MIKRPLTSNAWRASEAQWTTLICNDEAGIDRDIEALLGLLQERHGYTLEKANTELIRRLSFAS